MAKANKAAWLNMFKKKVKGGYGAARKKQAKPRGGGDLPDGLANAVARVTGVTFGKDKNGNPYVQLQAVCLDPEMVRGRKFTKFYGFGESVDDKGNVRKSTQDRLEEFTNDLQLMGCELPKDQSEIPDALEDWASERIVFVFNTWKPKEGQTQVFIQGASEESWEDDDLGNEDAESEDDDSDEEDEDEEEEESSKSKKSKASKKSKKSKEDEEDEEEEDEEDEEEPEEDDEEEEEEEEKPAKKAKAAKKKHAVSKSNKAKASKQDDEEDEEDEEEDESDDEEEIDWVPEKGDIVGYKGQEMEVLKINKAKQTADLMDEKSKPHKAVPFSKLKQV